MDLSKLSAQHLAERANNKELNILDFIEELLADCKQAQGELNIFTCLAEKEALLQAEAVEKKIKNGINLPLAGVPVAVRDDFCTGRIPAGLGSEAFRNLPSPISATAVEKLVGAGAVVIGKTNTGDMGIGASTEGSPYGPTRNPWNRQRVAESAGAAALAAGTCLLALESDTEGSLRQGAAHCGVFGLRPSQGRISRHGLNLHAGSFGRSGLAALSAGDLGIALKVAAGYDDHDFLTSINLNGQKNDGRSELEKVRIAFPDSIGLMIDSDREKHFSQFLNILKDCGFATVNSALHHLELALKAFQVISLVETSSTFARFDGIRFGTAEEADNLEDMYRRTRRSTFGKDACRHSVFGTYLLSKGQYEPYYLQALKIWTLFQQQINSLFENCDILALPVVCRLPHYADTVVGFLDQLESSILTAPISLTGLPSLVVPFGKIEDMPLGIQLIGRSFTEDLLLIIGEKVVAQTECPEQGCQNGEVN